MPTPAPASHQMTPAAYLAWEAAQPSRHGYFRGEVFAMAGAKPRHNAIAARVLGAFGAQLADRPCLALSSDQKVQLEAAEHYGYADAVLVCDEPRFENDDVLTNPSVVVEVLSKTTESYDRGLKWEAYQELASLEDYLLFAQAAPRIEHFFRQPDGAWGYRAFGPGERVKLGRGLELDVDSIYAGVLELPGD